MTTALSVSYILYLLTPACTTSFTTIGAQLAHSKLQGAIIKLTPVPLATNTTTTLLLIGLLVGIGVVAAGDVAAGGAGFDVFGFGYLVFVCFGFGHDELGYSSLTASSCLFVTDCYI
mmetsp:Transcript_5826/g.9811  ORF Transcript_5826/g.9811 Transcript_5826/m.9811 type:complete len:117 (-) Transcript_5826:111-461(-)